MCFLIEAFSMQRFTSAHNPQAQLCSSCIQKESKQAEEIIYQKKLISIHDVS